MSSPDIFYAVGIGLSSIGLLCLILIASSWRSVGRFVNDTWSKITAECVQGLSGVISLASAFAAAAEKPGWFAPAAAGTFSLVIWKLVQIIVDNRVKAGEKKYKSALERVEQQLILRTNLIVFLRRPIRHKLKLLRSTIRERTKVPGISHVRKALISKPHLEVLLETLGVFLQQQLEHPDGSPNNFRLGVFVEQEGVMTPAHWLNLMDPDHLASESFAIHREHFRINGSANPAHLLQCLIKKRMIIAEDCKAMAERGAFFYFNDAQRAYLMSMVVYYLGNVYAEFGTIKQAVLVIDTDVPGFFRESERASLEFCLGEYCSRIKLEMSFQALLAKRGNP